MTVERFRREDLKSIRLQPAQVEAASVFDDQDYLQAIETGLASTVRAPDGRVVAIGGAMEFEDGSVLWGFLAEDCRPQMAAIVRMGQRIVQVARKPVFSTVRCGFDQGCRLMQILGFEQQAHTVRGVASDGGEHHVFVRTA